MTDTTIIYRRVGDAMVPLRSQRMAFDRQFVDGRCYRLTEREDRSSASHSHYFAAINEAWNNLPDDLRKHYPSAEHLRVKALIEIGYADEEIHVCDTEADAIRLEIFARRRDTFSIVERRGALVKIWRAKSQKRSNMDKTQFQNSKDKVLGFVASLIGVSVDDLNRNAGMSA